MQSIYLSDPSGADLTVGFFHHQEHNCPSSPPQTPQTSNLFLSFPPYRATFWSATLHYAAVPMWNWKIGTWVWLPPPPPLSCNSIISEQIFGLEFGCSFTFFTCICRTSWQDTWHFTWLDYTSSEEDLDLMWPLISSPNVFHWVLENDGTDL